MINKRNKAYIYFNNKKAGILERTSNGYRFSYNNDYLSLSNSSPISLTLPLSDKPYENKSLFPFFIGLIPEGWFLEITSRTLKIDSENLFDILLSTCRDCIGNISIVPFEEREEE